MKNDAVVVIPFNKYKEILLQKKDVRFLHWPGYWALIGGGIGTNETELEALYREINEEIGSKAVIQNVRRLFEYQYQEKLRFGTMFVYTCDIATPLSDFIIGEGAGLAYFTKEEILDLKIIPYCKEVLLKIL